MDSLVYTLLNDALAVTVMAVVVVSLAWIFRRPAVTHCLWLIVMLKLIAPPLMPISLPVGSFFPPIESSPAPLEVDHASGSPTQVEALPSLVLDESPQRTDDAWSAAELPRVADDEPALTGADDNQVILDGAHALIPQDGKDGDSRDSPHPEANTAQPRGRCKVGEDFR